MISPLHAILLGLVEGLTEFLPVSSTGHLILASALLGLQGEAVKIFEVVIQAGALVAVLGLYRARVAAMWRGLLGRDRDGRRLLVNLLISFMPSAVVGVLAHHAIERSLFGVRPVVLALAAGGVFMITVEPRLRVLRARPTRKSLETIMGWEAFVVGTAQCLALWPGTSRSMVTLVAGLWLGWSASVAAEYSFLLALPTLGAATVYSFLTGRHVLSQGISPWSMACGFLVAGVVAWLAMRGFVVYLRRRGLAPFGWYRIGLAAVVWCLRLRA